MRKIIQIISAPTSRKMNDGTDILDYNLFALCDDGTLWGRDYFRMKWQLIKGVPQDDISDDTEDKP